MTEITLKKFLNTLERLSYLDSEDFCHNNNILHASGFPDKEERQRGIFYQLGISFNEYFIICSYDSKGKNISITVEKED